MHVTLRDIRQGDIPLVKPWLIAKENAKWLTSFFFQNESLRDEQLAMFLMRRDKCTFIIECESVPVGIAGLTNIDSFHMSAEIWCVIGDTNYRKRGVFTTAVILTLQRAFSSLHLHSVYGWAVEGNVSIHALQKLGFTVSGRQRESHIQDGIFKDKVLLDLLAQEFESGPFKHQQTTI